MSRLDRPRRPDAPILDPLVVGLMLLAVTLGSPALAQVSARDTGARGDGATDDTRAIQQAIDLAANKGHAVIFPPGTYLCGHLELPSGITLRLEPGAVLKGARKRSAYPPREELPFPNDADHETACFKPSLLFAENAERVSIEGPGTILMDFEKRGGPKPVALRRCRDVRIRDLTILNAPNYAISLLGCEEVDISGVTILNAFADGIDPDACRNVRISNCRVESVDDAIVPKSSFSLGEARPAENIVVTGCILSTVCNGFKLGTESRGGFRNITVSNCVITGFKDRRPAISGISLETVDGGMLQGINISNVSMVNARAPIFIRLGNRGRDMAEPVPGVLKDVVISGVTARNASLAASITGIPGHPARDITLRDLYFEFSGANPFQPWEAVPEKEDAYPEALMFGGLPAYALYCRHVEGLTLENITVRWREGFWRLTTDVYRDISWPEEGALPSHAQPADPGTACHFESVAGLVCRNLRISPAPPASEPVTRCVNVRSARFDVAPLPPASPMPFMAVSGADCADILLRGIPESVTNPFWIADPVVPAGAVRTSP